MKYLSATQAGRVIGVNEKTIRLWIAQGKLSAHHASKNRLAIPESEVERIARERSQYTDVEHLSLPALAHQVEQLRAQLTEQQAEIEKLKEQQASAPSRSLWQDDKYTPNERPIRTPRHQSTTNSEPLPPGAILAKEFAERHGVNQYTFRDHITKGIRGDILYVSERPKPGRPYETERFLLPEQQEQALAFWRRHDVPFLDKKSD